MAMAAAVVAAVTAAAAMPSSQGSFITAPTMQCRFIEPTASAAWDSLVMRDMPIIPTGLCLKSGSLCVHLGAVVCHTLPSREQTGVVVWPLNEMRVLGLLYYR